MKRNYKSGVEQSASFFIGREVEHTPAYGTKTLFVVGIQDFDAIEKYMHNNNCSHIFFGANHSFNLINDKDYQSELDTWDKMIIPFLQQEVLCSLDIPISIAEQASTMAVTQHHNFIGQLRVPVPYVSRWNDNTMIKIDDKDFNASNTGVWTHQLNKLLDDAVYTDWSKYNQDEIIGDLNG